MTAYTAFVKKEFCEQIRTYKLLVLGLVFLLLGMMNPLTAKFLPELVENFLPAEITMEIPEPTMMDSWIQFFKNVPQMGLFVLVLVFGGSISGELQRGTLIPVLTKGMMRRTVIFSKFTAACLTWTAAYTVCFGVSWLYSAYFWGTEIDMRRLLAAVGMVWLFGILLLSVELLGGILFTGGWGSLLFTGIFIVLQFLLGIIPAAGDYLPVRLVSDNMEMLQSQAVRDGFGISVLITVLTTLLCLGISVLLFNKKHI
ncbi:ABC transporter permease subunit [Ruminococcus sp. OA3]|uniref:ABC transporter permease n=1 Tax=Ruminococcus sp. OA3 TaxID=2914164 RepID=UPI001F0679DE|nr:ABC transporter permease subunit [Ruminococcus sp. OA3]MCH1983195.1 ABC transporter permease subunit [Ruminococcus sp. OA3]